LKVNKTHKHLASHYFSQKKKEIQKEKVRRPGKKGNRFKKIEKKVSVDGPIPTSSPSKIYLRFTVFLASRQQYVDGVPDLGSAYLQ